MIVKVIIPAYNEEESIAKVVKAISQELVKEIIVANNNSSDNTSEEATKAGATVIDQKLPGYGNACLKGMQYIAESPEKPDIIVFIDGDFFDYTEQMIDLVNKIKEGFDLVIGSRALGNKEKGSMTPPQVFGNWLSTFLIKLFYKYSYTDLGPFRAITYKALLELDMQDKNYGWTVEMQLKAVHKKMKIVEVPVDYKKRIGTSKISGTVKGVIFAGIKIITTIFKYRK